MLTLAWTLLIMGCVGTPIVLVCRVVELVKLVRANG